MKKVIMIVAAAFVAFSANAQFYAGGSFSLDLFKFSDKNFSSNESSLGINPEIGYKINDTFSVGAVLSLFSEQAEGTGYNTITFNPYLRYNFAAFGPLKLFVDGILSYNAYNNDNGSSSGFGAAVSPGLSFDFVNKLSIAAHIASISYFKVDGGNNFNLNIWSSTSIGLYYNF